LTERLALLEHRQLELEKGCRTPQPRLRDVSAGDGSAGLN
jgi:hypothetical protein